MSFQRNHYGWQCIVRSPGSTRLGSHHRVSNQVALAIWNFSQMVHITLAHAKCCRFARLLTLIIRWNDAQMKPLSLGYHLTLWAETFNYFTRFVSTTTKSSTYITIFSKWSFSLYLCIYLSVCLCKPVKHIAIYVLRVHNLLRKKSHHFFPFHL